MPTVKPADCTIATSPEDPKHADELLDEAIWESFPASDPVAITIDRAPEERGRQSDRAPQGNPAQANPTQGNPVPQDNRARQSNLNRKDQEKLGPQPPTGDLLGRRPTNR